jgi:hypothetical protein
MTVATPDWLSKRGGQLRLNYDGHTWVVCFDGEPQYLVRPVPAAGKFSCEVEQMNNGRRLDAGATYPTAEDAIRGGLEELRKALGW